MREVGGEGADGVFQGEAQTAPLCFAGRDDNKQRSRDEMKGGEGLQTWGRARPLAPGPAASRRGLRQRPGAAPGPAPGAGCAAARTAAPPTPAAGPGRLQGSSQAGSVRQAERGPCKEMHKKMRQAAAGRAAQSG